MTLKNGDFAMIDYTGTLEDGAIFDTTIPSIAQKAGMATHDAYKPVTICVGEGMLVPGLDQALVGKDVGSFTVTLEPNEAFGKKDPKLLRVVPTAQLGKQGIRPLPGMRLSIDGNYGTVLRTGGGRTMVDFNHPLASQIVTYEVSVKKIVTDVKEQVEALLAPLGLNPQVAIEGTRATITLAQLLPKPIMDVVQERIVKLTSVTTVTFEKK